MNKPVSLGLLLLALLAWLWPIGVGGCMPVGGDVTQFFLGLMAVLSESLHAGRLPIWTDLWGYGFPALAESQMGVLYPPHLLLYGTLRVENAYVASMLLHTLWGGLGARWLARLLGISALGSTLTAFAWSTCGFFMVHLAHPWGYTTGSWIPWALGLAWLSLSRVATNALDQAPPRGPRLPALWLSVALVLQILPGHFQIAFITHVTIGLMIVWTVAERAMTATQASSMGTRTTVLRAAAVLLAAAAAFPLAGVQLWPTARLARLAANQRTFEYLCGFAATPFHLVNFIAPGLFHRSPLWRPVVWDPFHTSPEENLAYVGLVPLLLALCGIKSGIQRDPVVRVLTLLLAATLFFSLGPYMPGFRQLIHVPGFSFFRAPARWSLISSLALAMLAGKGFDAWQASRQAARGLWAFVAGALIWVVLTLGVLELAVHSTEPRANPLIAAGFTSIFEGMPWYGDKAFDPPDPSFASVLAQARRPMSDPRIPANLPQKQQARSFVAERWSLYEKELREPVAFLVLLAVLGWLIDRGYLRTERTRLAFLLITFVDLWLLGRHRLVDIGPLAPLTQQSRLLGRLAQEPRGTRSADGLRNLPMVAGVAPISAYRTLTLPAVDSLTAMALPRITVPSLEPLTQAALRATGVSLRVFNPTETLLERMKGRSTEGRETIEDPILASWIYGADWTALRGDWVKTFTIARSNTPAARAWLIPKARTGDLVLLDPWSGDPREILTLFDSATPLISTPSDAPESWSIEVDAQSGDRVVISQLSEPQWKAHWIENKTKKRIDAPVSPVFRKDNEPGGWQSVWVPYTGRWTLYLEYEAADVAEGAAISIVAWVTWFLVFLCASIKYRSHKPGMPELHPTADSPVSR